MGNSLYFKDKPLVGLDISQTGLKLMAINQKKSTVSAYGSVDLDPIKLRDSLEKPSDTFLETNLSQLLSRNVIGSLPSDHVVLSIPTTRTFTRTFTVPASTEKHLAEAVELEVDQYIPLPADTLYVDYEVIERSKDTITVLLSAAPRVLIDRCVDIISKNGLQVCMVEPSINSVARLIKSTEDGHLVTVIVDIGPANTDIAVLDGSIKVTASIGIGGNTFTLDIAKRMKIPLENAHQLKVLNGLNPGPRQDKIKHALTPSLDRILAETRKVIRYYNERLLSDNRKIEQILVVGGGSNVPGIGDYFTNALVMPARIASPWQKLNFGSLEEPAKQFRPRYIAVAGLALTDQAEIWK